MSEDEINDSLRNKLDLIVEEGGYASRADALDALIATILGKRSGPVTVPPAAGGAKGGNGGQVIIQMEVPPDFRFDD